MPGRQMALLSGDLVLKVQNVSKYFSESSSTRPVLQDVSFTVSKGDIVAVVGKTGIGKSTFLDILAGIQQSTEGVVAVGGAVGYIMQKDPLLPWRTVRRNILLPLEFEAGHKSRVDVNEIISDLQLAEYAESYPHELSGGTRQKVSIARLLVQNPLLTLLDEPFSAMDITARIRIIRYLRAWVATTQAGVVFITHSIDEALALADRVIVLAGAPACVGTVMPVDIPEQFRDPVSIRQLPGYSTLFNTLWTSLDPA